MTALSEAKCRLRRAENQIRSESFTVAPSTTIYQGALVAFITNSTTVTNATSAANRSAAIGVAKNTVVQTASSTYKVEVEYGHEELFTISANITVASIGKTVGATDNDSLDTITSLASNQCRVGKVVSVPSSTTAWIAVGVAGFADT